MWNKDHVWLHYVKNIIAADIHAAVFLASYLRQVSIDKSHLPALEVLDLQRYKVITHPGKIRTALRDRAHIPFIFVIGKN